MTAPRKSLLAAAVLGLGASLALNPVANVNADDDANANANAKKLPPVKPADSDAPLAEGWPGGTAPGVIEIKKYPAYRSAVAVSKDIPLNSMADNIMFWPLFNHIDRSGIEMTTPVVNTYTPAMIETPDAKGEMTMEFVYRSTRLGETGKGVGPVKVVDHPEATYVCLGVQGRMNNDVLREGVAKLEAWLEQNKEWVKAGSPRRLGYHGPMTPVNQRLWEVQIPVVPANAAPGNSD